MRAKEEAQLKAQLEAGKIIAILRKVPLKDFCKTVEALAEGGIRMMEVTFDPAGEMEEKTTLEQIRIISREYPDIMPGAGTVLTTAKVREAAEAGAEFILSPNTDEAVIRETKRCGLISVPGALTATEIQNAHMWGADYVKIFPAGRLGCGYIKDIAAPLPHIRFLAVGGVDGENLQDFFKAGCVGVGIGSCLVDKKLIREGRFGQLRELAEELTARIGKEQ